ncbi:hypothetical protein EKPJFOCH_4388 [Methylobacterium thuringiense]|uniref:Uncharacterized protein n=1 Tax=Methylobacterium thuringiense TaxID=1003091 RepID=A0ABQ4TS64_9HYPH|nr:hypothetical protein EKPJFOCH_4388 [Methylobacterium thuringiense]
MLPEIVTVIARMITQMRTVSNTGAETAAQRRPATCASSAGPA